MSLFFGFIIVTIKDAYQNFVLGTFCSTLYKFGPNAGCDLLLNLPDLGFVVLILGVLGIVFSAYMDFSENSGWGR